MAALSDFDVMRSEYLEEQARTLFIEYDKDQSGTIDLKELGKVIKGLGLCPEWSKDDFKKFAAAEMERGDKNKDGQLSWDEFVDYHNRLVELQRVQKELAASKQDRVALGELPSLQKQSLTTGRPVRGGVVELLDPDEMEAEIAKAREQARRVFKVIDEDHSGTIEVTELPRLLKQLDIDMDESETELAAKSALSQIDQDLDGVISMDEFAEFYTYFLGTEKGKKRFLKNLEKDVLSDFQVQRARQLFFDHDVDQSGTIDSSELLGCLQALELQLSKEQLQEIISAVFDEADRDKSKAIEFEEFLCLYQTSLSTQKRREKYSNKLAKKIELTNEQQEKARQLFDAHDKDKSNTIEGGELEGVLKECLKLELPEDQFQDLVAHVMSAADKDSSGNLNFEQFQFFYKKCLASDRIRNNYEKKVSKRYGSGDAS